MKPVFLEDGVPFPSAEKATQEGIVACGGKLTTERLIEAYSKGIFPWYNEEKFVIWWSPNPRMVLFPKELHISKNMQRMLQRHIYKVTYNQCFVDVIDQCANVKRKNQIGTWILPEMVLAYTQLHHLGYAHSVEVWQDSKLVGGLYGMCIGNVFCGESMFSLTNNASQYGFITFVQEHQEIKLIDCQVYTDYLQKLGAREIPRKQYIEILKNGTLL